MRREQAEQSKGLISDSVLEELMSDDEKPEDLLGEKGLFRELKRRLLERALDAALTGHPGYDRHPRSGHGTGNSRNGRSGKRLQGEDGELEIAVPRDRNATFDPRIVRKGQRRFDGFDDTIISMCARGMSVREIRKHLQELYGVEVSPDLISRVTDTVLSNIRAWQSRALDRVYPAVIFDALRVKIREEGMVRNKAVYLALAIPRDGDREVLGVWIENQEGVRFWLKVMNELRNRGLQDILIAGVDGLKGFPEAIQAVFPQTVIQTCIVHLVRYSLNFCSDKDRRPVAADLKQIYRAETAEAAEDRLAAFEKKWNPRYPPIGQSWRRNGEKIIPFFAFRPDIRKILYTTNAIESLHMTIRKSIKTRGSFPNDEAATKLIYLAITNAGQIANANTYAWKTALNQFAILFADRRDTRQMRNQTRSNRLHDIPDTPLMPRRMSVTPVASHTRTPPGTGIIAAPEPQGPEPAPGRRSRGDRPPARSRSGPPPLHPPRQHPRTTRTSLNRPTLRPALLQLPLAQTGRARHRAPARGTAAAT